MDLKELPFHAFARHPWEIVRADFFLRLLRDRVKGNDLSALDLGAGDAYFARRLVGALPAVSRMTCFDLAYDARWLADRADAENSVDKLGEIQFTSTKPDERFDLIVMLDVLEHTADDRAALREATSSLLKPGGWLLLSVPAWPALFSRHDETLGHHRRYTPARLRAGCRGEPDDRGPGELFASLLVPRAFATLGEIAFGGGKRGGHGASASGYFAFKMETRHMGDLGRENRADLGCNVLPSRRAVAPSLRGTVHLGAGENAISQASVALVVPCFDEEARLDRSAFLALVDDAPCLNLVFVDDGSRDQTLAILHAMARERPDHIEVVALPKNRGKAEAVRRDFSMRWQVRSRLPASSTRIFRLRRPRSAASPSSPRLRRTTF